MKSSYSSFSRILCVCSLFTIPIVTSHAAEINIWQGGSAATAGEWSDPANWSLGRVPVATDTVQINGNVTIASEANFETLSATGNFTIEDGAVITGSKINDFGSSTQQAIVHQTSGTVNLTFGGDYLWGVTGPKDSPSEYYLSGGTLQGANDGNWRIGNYGSGILYQTGGDIISKGYFVLGRWTGDEGTYKMSGGTFTLEKSDRNILVGEAGHGTLEISDKARVNTTGIHIGNGDVSITDGAYVRTGSFPYDNRYNGTATLKLDNVEIEANPNAFKETFIAAPITTTIGAGGVTLNITNGLNATIATSLNGDASDGGIIKTGEGVLRLENANTYTGKTDISNGVVVVAAPNALTHTKSIYAADGAGIGLYATATATERDALFARVTRPADSTLYWALDTAENQSATFSETIPAGTHLVKTGNGALTVTSAQSYTRPTRIYAGILKAGAENVLTSNGPIAMFGGSYSPYATTYNPTFGTNAGEISTRADMPLSFSALTTPLTLGYDGLLTFGEGGIQISKLVLNAASADQPLTVTANISLASNLQMDFPSSQPVTFTVPVTGSSAQLYRSGSGNVTFEQGLDLGTGEIVLAGGNTTFSGLIKAGNFQFASGGNGTFKDVATDSKISLLNIPYNNNSTVDFESGTLYTDYLILAPYWEDRTGILNMKTGTINVGGLRLGDYGNGTINQTGGTISTAYEGYGENGIGGYVNDAIHAVGTYNLSDGSFIANYNFQIGRYGTGKFIQTGGAFTSKLWFSIGRFVGSNGEYDLSNGTFDHVSPGFGIVIGEEGNGTWTIHDGGKATVQGSFSFSGGSGWTQSGYGVLNLLEGGSLYTKGMNLNDTRCNMKFYINGGTLGALGDGVTYDQFFKDLSNIEIGEKGMTFDTGNNTVAIDRMLASNLSVGKVTKIGSGTLVLPQEGNWVGGTDVQAGNVIVGPAWNRVVKTGTTESTTAGLTHRWSFEESLTDAVTGEKATVLSDNGTDISYVDGAARLPGGSKGTCCIDLGSNLFPNDNTPVTLEIWAKQNSVQQWARVFDFGGEDNSNYIMLSWVRSTDINLSLCEIKKSDNDINNYNDALSPFTLDQWWHIAVTLIPNYYGDGRMWSRWEKRDVTGALRGSVVMVTPFTFSFADLKQSHFYLGRSHHPDYDANADYSEVRIWQGLLTSEQLTENAKLGAAILPDMEASPVLNVLPNNASESLVANNYLTHRWSFNGDSKDSVGTQDATLCGSAYYTEDKKSVYLPGGEKGTSWIDLQRDVLPKANTPITIEIWATTHSYQSWSRLFEFGNPNNYTEDNILICWTQSINPNADGVCVKAVHKNDSTINAFGGYKLNQRYHIAFVFTPNGDSSILDCYQRDADTGILLKSTRIELPNWSVANLTMTDCWLGRSHYPDNDANATYEEVRIWNAALSEPQLRINAIIGPDHVPSITNGTIPTGSFSPLNVAEGATFNNGGNPISLETITGAGTITGTAPITITDTIDPAASNCGTLTINNNIILTGTYMVDTTEEISDLLTGTGTLDLSQATIKVRDITTLKKPVYTIAQVANIIGKPKIDLQRSGYTLQITGGTVKLTTSGTILYLR